MSKPKLINQLVSRPIIEHQAVDVTSLTYDIEADILFKGNKDYKCIECTRKGKQKLLQPSYFIGSDWLVDKELAIYVAPKVDEKDRQIDYLKILYTCLTCSDIAKYVDQLYEVKIDQKYIQINQEQDLLTPLLILSFLQLLKEIVRKGLKKSYYSVDRNLNSRVKGKIKVAQNIKLNLLHNKKTKTLCQYEVFGYDSIENRLLKHTLEFIKRYSAHSATLFRYTQPLINYCHPAFTNVSDDVNLNELKSIKKNAFYKEYEEAIRTAQLILKRFGFNIKDAALNADAKTNVPPFWIDMSKLFEFYVFKLLKDRYGNKLIFQAQGTYGQPDFLLRDGTNKMILDAKYRPRYQYDKCHIEDIRQLSGYARDTKLLSKLGYTTRSEQASSVVDCILIYTDQKAGAMELPETLSINTIEGFTKFYKVALTMPIIDF